MKITDYIQRWRNKNSDRLYTERLQAWGDITLSKLEFSKVIFYNICDIKNELIEDVTFTRVSGDEQLFGEYVAFVRVWGRVVLSKLDIDGFCVVVHEQYRFRIMDSEEYYVSSGKVYAKDPGADIRVIKSDDFVVFGKSTFALLYGWLRFLDNVLNSSNTISSRLGTVVLLSPENMPQNPLPVELKSEQRKALEKDLQEGYGSLDRQNIVCVLNRKMNAQVINLAGADQRTLDKARLAILAVCDRLKVPANQVAIIDSTVTGNSLSNGGELRQGDLMKYQIFERLLQRTFINFATRWGLVVDYEIYNKPVIGG